MRSPPQSDDTVVVLENGCLCCTVFGDLVGTLNNLYHRREAGEIPPFDHVVIETSGLADPAPVAAGLPVRADACGSLSGRVRGRDH